MNKSEPLLAVQNLNAAYGESHVLHDVSMYANENEVVAILGRNGMGKTTLLKSIIGTITPRSGSIIFNKNNLIGIPTYERTRMGIALVPQNRRVLPNLTVRENLEIASTGTSNSQTTDGIYETFPRLKERSEQIGQSLSGGEQQMVAIARALLQNPQCLLLDEPFEGLAPKIIDIILDRLANISAENISVLIVGQTIEETLQLSDRSYIIEDGHVVYQEDASVLMNDIEAQERWLGI